MILSRLFSLILRIAEFVCAAVVLGITAWFLHVHHTQGTGPLGREIYTLIWAILAVLLSLAWLLPFTGNMMHYPMDLVMSGGWFAAFALLVMYIHDIDCGGAFHWSGITHGGNCNQWKADEAFSFLSAIFWLCSALLSMWVYHKRTTRVAGRRHNYV